MAVDRQEPARVAAGTVHERSTSWAASSSDWDLGGVDVLAN